MDFKFIDWSVVSRWLRWMTSVKSKRLSHSRWLELCCHWLAWGYEKVILQHLILPRESCCIRIWRCYCSHMGLLWSQSNSHLTVALSSEEKPLKQHRHYNMSTQTHLKECKSTDVSWWNGQKWREKDLQCLQIKHNIIRHPVLWWEIQRWPFTMDEEVINQLDNVIKKQSIWGLHK